MRTNMILMWPGALTIAELRATFLRDSGTLYPGVMQYHDGRLFQLGMLEGQQFMVPYEEEDTFEITGRSFIADNTVDLYKVWRVTPDGTRTRVA